MAVGVDGVDGVDSVVIVDVGTARSAARGATSAAARSLGAAASVWALIWASAWAAVTEGVPGQRPKATVKRASPPKIMAALSRPARRRGERRKGMG